MCAFLTPQYLLSLNICGGRGFPTAGLDSSGIFSRIHFLLASLAAMSHSSNSILFAARKPITSCCCFLICMWGRWERMQIKLPHPCTFLDQYHLIFFQALPLNILYLSAQLWERVSLFPLYLGVIKSSLKCTALYFEALHRSFEDVSSSLDLMWVSNWFGRSVLPHAVL